MRLETTQQGGRLVVQTIGVNPYDFELYLYDVDGTNPELLVGNLLGRVDSPSFSVDGRTVLYSRDVAGFNDASGRQLDAHIFTRRIDGSSTVDITGGGAGTPTSRQTGTNDILPRYSPDGFRVIFVNRDNDNLSPPEIWVADIDGRARLLSNAFLPDWK